MSNLLITPHVPFSDIDGTPLSDGFINIGEKNKDPIQFPISAYWDEEKTKPITQPIRTKNGYIVNNGLFAKIYIDEINCSVLVKNRFQTTIYLDSNSILFSNFTAVKQVVQVEKNRAIAAEASINISIANEVNRATNAEQALQSQLNANGIGNRAYLTYVAMNSDASNIPANSKATVTNDLDQIKNGDYQYDGSVFTKSSYDPVAQAKSYADANKLDLTNIQVEYIEGNKVGAKTLTYANWGIDASLTVVNQSAYASKVIPVQAGSTLYVFNSLQSYPVNTGHGSAFFDVDPVLNSIHTYIADQRVYLTDENTGDLYYKVVVPSGANFLLFNTKFNTDIVEWSINDEAFSNNYTQGTEVINALNKIGIKKQLSDLAASNLEYGNTQDGDIYNEINLIPDAYLNSVGYLFSNNGWKAYRFKVTEDQTYFIKVIGGLAFPKKFVYSKSDTTVDGVGGSFYVADVALISTDIADVYKFKVPLGNNIKAVFLNLKITDDFDITNTLSIQKNKFDVSKIRVSQPAVSKIGDAVVVDEEARKLIYESNNVGRFKNAKFYCFGDSITEGTQGGYVGYIASKLGAIVSNFGSSGARAGRLVAIMTGQPNRQESTPYTAPNYTNVSGISIMIGTNHSWQDPADLGSISEIPTTKITDYATEAEYWALFPDKFVTNIALCIEYVKWKNKELEIHLITPPYQTDATEGTYHITKLIPAIESVAKFYGVHLIYATYESGLAYKNLDSYTYDGTHLTALGNKVFGNFVANKILYL
ncbi:SGNH/GDSL hydrolase family protein [Acinetobacter sp. ULE_I001]|uniref:SGNH/GDSL hydrolase family protein n=1 Tax=unclassified Acinetobacter TaxID=196816 RepID=UPI003AFA0019